MNSITSVLEATATTHQFTKEYHDGIAEIIRVIDACRKASGYRNYLRLAHKLWASDYYRGVIIGAQLAMLISFQWMAFFIILFCSMALAMCHFIHQWYQRKIYAGVVAHFEETDQVKLDDATVEMVDTKLRKQ